MTASAAPAYDFRLNPRLDVTLQRDGAEQEPALVIDAVMRAPERLVDYAAREVDFAPVWSPNGGYPGIRAPAPLNYVETLVRSLSPIIEKAFQLSGVRLARADCTFSLVTLPPERLAPLQRIPHVDTVDPLQFAILHYLCDAGFGGTAFYRHRATAFETLSEDRRPIFEAARAPELANLPPAYITRDNAYFERTGQIEAAFDRLVVYRSRRLHSAQIIDPSRLSEDPRAGRLTANIFLNYRRA